MCFIKAKQDLSLWLQFMLVGREASRGFPLQSLSHVILCSEWLGPNLALSIHTQLKVKGFPQILLQPTLPLGRMTE